MDESSLVGSETVVANGLGVTSSEGVTLVLGGAVSGVAAGTTGGVIGVVDSGSGCGLGALRGAEYGS